MDDIVIYGTDWEEHLQNINEVFKRLGEAGLTVKMKKCKFGMHECSYLGYRIGSGGIRPVEVKLEAIKNIPIPMTKKDVRSFLGIVGYYRRFVPHFATKAGPLTEATRKGKPEKVNWTLEEQNSFEQLKSSLLQTPTLRNPDFHQPFILQTDASDVGIGAVLSQGVQDQPIAYYSRKLLGREQRYSTVEKECLAINLAIKAFANYLIGKPLVLQTDNRALTWLKSFREKNARLMRWSLVLQPYTFTVQHRKGRENANADALSRLPEEHHSFQLPKGGRDVRDLKETREFGKDHFRKDHLRKDPCAINQSHPAVIDQSHPAIIDQSHPATEDAPGIDPQPGL